MRSARRQRQARNPGRCGPTTGLVRFRAKPQGRRGERFRSAGQANSLARQPCVDGAESSGDHRTFSASRPGDLALGWVALQLCHRKKKHILLSQPPPPAPNRASHTTSQLPTSYTRNHSVARKTPPTYLPTTTWWRWRWRKKRKTGCKALRRRQPHHRRRRRRRRQDWNRNLRRNQRQEERRSLSTKAPMLKLPHCRGLRVWRN
jgi:hypothetical protein